MSSHVDAATIVSDYAKQAEKIREEAKVVPVNKNEFSTGVKFGQQAFLPVPKIDEGPMFSYKKPILISDGPHPPKVEDIETKGYIKFIRYSSYSYLCAHSVTIETSIIIIFVDRRIMSNELGVTSQSFRVNEHFKKHCKDFFILNNFESKLFLIALEQRQALE